MTDELRRVGDLIERRIRELAEAGELSGLPGEGRPLAGDPDVPGDRWAATHVAKNAGAIPEWSELRIEIDRHAAILVGRARRHLEWLRSRDALLRDLPAERILDTARITRAADARVRGELATKVDELNALIRRYDLIVPAASLQLAPPYTLDRVFARAERVD